MSTREAKLPSDLKTALTLEFVAFTFSKEGTDDSNVIVPFVVKYLS
jgi:hypothetical protein